jgi:chemotaxis protein histidine kinase CheA
MKKFKLLFAVLLLPLFMFGQVPGGNRQVPGGGVSSVFGFPSAIPEVIGGGAEEEESEPPKPPKPPKWRPGLPPSNPTVDDYQQQEPGVEKNKPNDNVSNTPCEDFKKALDLAKAEKDIALNQSKNAKLAGAKCEDIKSAYDAAQVAAKQAYTILMNATTEANKAIINDKKEETCLVEAMKEAAKVHTAAATAAAEVEGIAKTNNCDLKYPNSVNPNVKQAQDAKAEAETQKTAAESQKTKAVAAATSRDDAKTAADQAYAAATAAVIAAAKANSAAARTKDPAAATAAKAAIDAAVEAAKAAYEAATAAEKKFRDEKKTMSETPAIKKLLTSFSGGVALAAAQSSTDIGYCFHKDGVGKAPANSTPVFGVTGGWQISKKTTGGAPSTTSLDSPRSTYASFASYRPSAPAPALPPVQGGNLDLMSLNLGVSYLHLKGEDRHPERGASFDKKMVEVLATGDFYFINLLRAKRATRSPKVAPFLRLGAGFGIGNPNTVNGEQDTKKANFALPMGLGFRVNVTDKMALNLDYTTRVTFSDALDGVTGTTDNNDWYGSGGLGLSFLLGKKANDSDGDGFKNNEDPCPNVAGTLGGCPDADGIADEQDTCPNEAGDQRFNGCPDSDGDGARTMRTTAQKMLACAASPVAPTPTATILLTRRTSAQPSPASLPPTAAPIPTRTASTTTRTNARTTLARQSKKAARTPTTTGLLTARTNARTHSALPSSRAAPIATRTASLTRRTNART